MCSYGRRGRREGGGPPPPEPLGVPASHSQRGWGWVSLSLSADLSGRRDKVPLVPSPPTWGPSIRTPRAGMAGQVAKDTGFTFPTGTVVHVAWPCPSWPCTPKTGPRGSDQRAASLQKGGDAPQSSAPALGLKEFALLLGSLWKFASSALAEAPAPPQPSLATWPIGLGPLLAPSMPSP